MISNGMDVAVMEHHVSSSGGGMTNPYSQARITYYNIGGIPDSYFDGVLHEVGGYSGTYNAFVNLYNQRMAVQSNFNVDIFGFNTGLDYTVSVNLENVETYAGTNIVGHLALTESGVVVGSVYNHVTRLFVPDANGTPLDFSSTTTETLILNFSLDPTWVPEECELIALIQDNDSKEILQATKVPLLDLIPMTDNNASCQNITQVPILNCTGTLSPLTVISNRGAEALTSLDISYQVNDEDVNSYVWTGDLSSGQSEQLALPEVAFDILTDNELIIYSANPNGSEDEDTADDTTSTTFAASSIVTNPPIVVSIKLDDNPQETTWECKNSAGEVMYSGGPYTTPQALEKDTMFLTDQDCFTFAIYDEGGDGLVGGLAGYSLKGSYTSMFYNNNDFEAAEELLQFSVVQTSVPELSSNETFSVYPNPFKDYTYVSFTLSETENIEVNVYNVVGELIHSQQKEMGSGLHKLHINTEGFTSGVYFVNLKVGEKEFVEKIFTY